MSHFSLRCYALWLLGTWSDSRAFVLLYLSLNMVRRLISIGSDERSIYGLPSLSLPTHQVNVSGSWSTGEGCSICLLQRTRKLMQ